MTDATQLCRHLTVCGRVQGVGFRAWVEHEAMARGLEGFVRNRRNGSVEAVFRGPPELVRAMCEACRRGPRAAAPSDISQSDCGPELLELRRPGEAFSVLPTL